MSLYTKGVNTTDSTNRVRFENLSERLRKVNVDIIHKIHQPEGERHDNPNTGDDGCFFLDQLEHCKELDSSFHFKRFYFKVHPLVQSLIELIHHQNKVVDMLETQLLTVEVDEMSSYLLLVTVLGRDLQDDLYSNFHRLFDAILDVIDRTCSVSNPSPELAGKAFECLSYLLKHQMLVFLNDPEKLKQYYGKILGHSSAIARNFAAQSFSIITRKLKPKVFKLHINKLFRAIASIFISKNISEDNIKIIVSNSDVRNTDSDNLPKKVKDTIEGIGLLCFYTMKGVKGQLHSSGGIKFSSIIDGLLQCKVSSLSKPLTNIQTVQVTVVGNIMKTLLPKLFHHLHPTYMEETLLRMIAVLNSIIASCIEYKTQDMENPLIVNSLSSSIGYIFEAIYYAVCHSNNRSISEKSVRNSIAQPLMSSVFSLTELLLSNEFAFDAGVITSGIKVRCAELFCKLWQLYPDSAIVLKGVKRLIKNIIELNDGETFGVSVLREHVLLNLPEVTLSEYVINPMFEFVSNHLQLSEQTILQQTNCLYSSLDVLTCLYNISKDDLFRRKKSMMNLNKLVQQSKPGWEYEENNQDDGYTEYMDDDDEDDEEPRFSINALTAIQYEHASNNDVMLYQQTKDSIVRLLSSCRESLAEVCKFCLTSLRQVFKIKSKSVKLSNKLLTLKSDSASFNFYMVALQYLKWMAIVYHDIFLANIIKKDIIEFIEVVDSFQQLSGEAVLISLGSAGINESELSITPCSMVVTSLLELVCLYKVKFLSKIDAGRQAMNLIRSLVYTVSKQPKSLYFSNSLLTLVTIYSYLMNVDHFKWEIVLTDNEIQLFLNSITNVMSTPSHWLRLNIVQILSFFNIPVTNNADISKTGNNKPDVKSQIVKSSKSLGNDGNSIPDIDVGKLCLEAVCLPVEMRTEREFSRRLGTLEVLIQNSRIPPIYVRALCSFCLGVFHIKFKLFWEPATLVLVAAFNSQFSQANQSSDEDDLLWSLLFESINDLTRYSPTESFNQEAEGQSTVSSNSSILNELLSKDDGSIRFLSPTTKSFLFPYTLNADPLNLSTLSTESTGLVDVDSRTDLETVYLMLWNILKRCPHITLKRSKIVIPLFINFLSQQYYKHFQNDVDIPLLLKLGLISVPNSDDSNLANDATSSQLTDNNSALPELPPNILKKRLEKFLEVLSEVTSPKQLYMHKLLYHYYITLLSRSEVEVVKLAVKCLLTYKYDYFVPYKERFSRLLDEKTFRDELLLFNLNSNIAIKSNSSSSIVSSDKDGENRPLDAVITENHRDNVIPLIARLAYGRFFTKTGKQSNSAKDQANSRRVAILSFFHNLSMTELRHVVQLMFRGILPQSALVNISVDLSPNVIESKMKTSKTSATLTAYYEVWYNAVDDVIFTLKHEALREVVWERQIGFLFLLDQFVRVLGFALTPYIEGILNILSCMIKYIQYLKQCNKSEEVLTVTSQDDNNVIEEVDDELACFDEYDEKSADLSQYNNTNASRVRTMCFLRLAEIIHQFCSRLDLNPVISEVFVTIPDLIRMLPQSITTCGRKPPALLRLIDAVVEHDETISVVTVCDSESSNTNHTDISQVLLQCIAHFSSADSEIIKLVIKCIFKLSEYNNGQSILPHANLIVNCFCKRFLNDSIVSPSNFTITDGDIDEVKLTDMKALPSGSIKHELMLLCHLSESIFSPNRLFVNSININQQSIKNLSTLLLGMLRTYIACKKIRIEQEWVLNILRIYKSLLWRIDDIRNHVPFISRLFGPASHLSSLFNTTTVRNMLLVVYVEISCHKSTHQVMKVAAAALSDLLAQDIHVVDDSRDFDRCMPVFQGLSSSSETKTYSWGRVLYQDDKCSDSTSVYQYDTSLCSVVIYECLRCLYDKELVIRGAALAALKHLVDYIFHRVTVDSDDGIILAKGLGSTELIDILKSVVLPAVRLGLKKSFDIIKRGFINLFAHIIQVSYQSKTVKWNEVSDIISTAVNNNANTSIYQLFHCDLYHLYHDDPEQNFFENISHIQIHRRIRAMNKLKTLLNQRFYSRSDIVDTNQTIVSSTIGMIEDINDHIVQSNELINITPAEDIISQSSFVNVLLPLAFHPLLSEEFVKKDHLPYMQESAALLGSICQHLSWSHYYFVLKTILKQLEKMNQEKEKVLVTALCSVLDSFHFDLVTTECSQEDFVEDAVDDASIEEILENPDEIDETDETVKNADIDIVDIDDSKNLDNEGLKSSSLEVNSKSATVQANSIASTLVNTIIPWIKIYLLKDELDQNGEKTKVIRPQVAVALAKIVHKLQPPVMPDSGKHSLFKSLIISVIGTFRSRDVSVRDAARDSLVKIIGTLGITYSLRDIIYELCYTLKEGYQRHVCSYTIRSLLTQVLKDYIQPVDSICINMNDLVSVDQSDKNTGLMSLKISKEFILSNKPSFDECFGLIMDVVVDDLIGFTHQDREVVDGVNRSLIREAKGIKSYDILELCSKYLLFRPTYALINADDPVSVSSIHMICNPLISLLMKYENEKSVINRLSEALQHVAIGLSQNISVVSTELLLYLHSTLHPFVIKIIKEHEQSKKAKGYLRITGQIPTLDEDGNIIDPMNTLITDNVNVNDNTDVYEDDDIYADLPSYLREDSSDDEGTSALYSETYKKKKKSDDNVTGHKASIWLPNDSKHLTNQRDIIKARDIQNKLLYKVELGSSAPQLTGRNRYDNKRLHSSKVSKLAVVIDPATIQAVKYCLTLFNLSTKRNLFDVKNEDIRNILTQFLPLLGHCLRLPGASDVVSLAMRCISTLLSWDIYIIDNSFSRVIGGRMLKLMFQGGILVSSDNELVQACLKGLTTLFQIFNRKSLPNQSNLAKVTDNDEKAALLQTNNPSKVDQLPLKEVKIRLLIQLLTSTIMEITTNYQNAAFQLIKSIVETRILLPEIYDLINKLMDQLVLSQRKSVRDLSSNIVIDFIINYPLGEKRFLSHFNQLLGNCSYEFEEGRMSVLTTLMTLIKLLPVPVLNDLSSTIFLPLSLRLINDESSSCRNTIAELFMILFRRVDSEVCMNLSEYIMKWLSSEMLKFQRNDDVQIYSNSGKQKIDKLNCDADVKNLASISNVQLTTQSYALIRIGSLLASILVQSKPELLKKSSDFKSCVEIIRNNLLILLVTTGEISWFRVKYHHRSLDNTLNDGQEGQGNGGGCEPWAVIYNLLIFLEKLLSQLSTVTERVISELPAINHVIIAYLHQNYGIAISATSTSNNLRLNKSNDASIPRYSSEVANDIKNNDSIVLSGGCNRLMELVQESMLYPHIWVRSVACRVLNLSLARRDPLNLKISSLSAKNGEFNDYLLESNAMYQLARRLCIVINQPYLSDDLLMNATAGLVFTVRAMYHNPELCSNTFEVNDIEPDDGEKDIKEVDEVDDSDDDEIKNDMDSSFLKTDDHNPRSSNEVKTSISGANWVMQRLRNIGSDTRGLRRLYALNIFISLVEAEDNNFIISHMRQLVEVALRIELTMTGPDEHELKMIKEKSTKLLELLEIKVGSSYFFGVYSELQRHLQSRRAEKKRMLAASAIVNPKEYAINKSKKRKNIQDSKKSIRDIAVRIADDKKLSPNKRFKNNLAKKRTTKF